MTQVKTNRVGIHRIGLSRYVFRQHKPRKKHGNHSEMLKNAANGNAKKQNNNIYKVPLMVLTKTAKYIFGKTRQMQH